MLLKLAQWVIKFTQDRDFAIKWHFDERVDRIGKDLNNQVLNHNKSLMSQTDYTVENYILGKGIRITQKLIAVKITALI